MRSTSRWTSGFKRIQAHGWPGRHQWGRKPCEAEIEPVRGAFACKLCHCSCRNQSLYATICQGSNRKKGG
eukprot:4675166-Alexandrium_andersonii.AAC.1